MRTEGIRIRMKKCVRGLMPISPSGTILYEGMEYNAVSNPHGAISGICQNGQLLGVKPGEFSFIAAPKWVLKIHGVSLDERMLEWIRNGERGTSSETIFEVLADHPLQREGWAGATPRDPADFRRCYLLLEAIPEWKTELQKVADVYPAWQPLVDNWSELERLYLIESADPAGKVPRLYMMLARLNGEEE